MRRSDPLIRYITIVLSVILIAGIAVGCMKKDDPQGELTEYSEGVVERFFDKLHATIRFDSSADIELPELTSEQKELMEYAYSGTKVELGEVEIDDNNDDKGTVELEFSGYKAYSDDLTKIATMDEYKSIVDDIKAEKTTVKLKAVKVNDEWIFKDMSEIKEMFYDPYVELCFLDDEGEPINITDAYTEYVAGLYGDIYVESYWYDPVMGNPLLETHVSSPIALQNVFYFNQPVSGEFTAQLSSRDTVIATLELTVTDEVTVVCDFPAGNGFASGDYTVTLMVGTIPIAYSTAITIN